MLVKDSWMGGHIENNLRYINFNHGKKLGTFLKHIKGPGNLQFFCIEEQYIE